MMALISIKSTKLEAYEFSHAGTHKVRGQVTLETNYDSVVPPVPLDIILIIDASASMGIDNKFTHTLKLVEHLLTHLQDCHKLTVITFNHEFVIPVLLLECTSENKIDILNRISTTVIGGSTNISEALFAGIDVT